MSKMAKQMARRASVTVLGSHVVKPAGEQAHDGPLDMTTWDQLFGVVHNKTVLLYNPSSSQDWVVKTLLGSLGRALAQFSPFAGRLRWADKEPRRLEIVCNGEGAEVVEAECDVEMSSFRDHTDPENMALLAPEVDYERPLEELPVLLVRLTRFRCGGVALGLSSAHMAADGQAAFHFFSDWARLARGEAMKEAPSLLYRAMFRERERHNNNGRQLSFSDHVEFQDLPTIMSSGEEGGIEEWEKETAKLALPFTKAQLDALKKDASSLDNGHAISPSFSRYEVLTAHIWRCLCKARRHDYEQQTILSFPINVRKHIQTIPLPRATFGNMVITMRAKSQAGELISNPLGFACGKLRETINNVDEDYIWSNFELLEKQDDLSSFMKDASVASKTLKEGRSYNGNPNLKVTSWLSLPIHDLDFGFGDVIEIIPLVRDIDGSTILLPDLNNDGSIIVLLCLQVAHVDEFKKHFYKHMN